MPALAHHWAEQFLDVSQHEQTHEARITLDETVAPALVDRFYAGVSRVQGITVLQRIREIVCFTTANLLFDARKNKHGTGAWPLLA